MKITKNIIMETSLGVKRYSVYFNGYWNLTCMFDKEQVVFNIKTEKDFIDILKILKEDNYPEIWNVIIPINNIYSIKAKIKLSEIEEIRINSNVLMKNGNRKLFQI